MAASTAGAKYAQVWDSQAGTAESTQSVPAEAGRKCVRNIQQYPVMSHDWLMLVDSLKQLTRLLQFEARMPTNATVADTVGRNKESDGTLWDQEAHENTIRILVEEAKVNLCVRMMGEFKRLMYNEEELRGAMAKAAKDTELTEAQLERKCVDFEDAMGLLLRRSFMHVETLQLIDIPMLIEYCSTVFNTVPQLGSISSFSRQSQEYVVLYYFASLMKHSEELNSPELLARTRESGLVHQATNHILVNLGDYPAENYMSIAEGFAALADNEDFQTNWEQFFEKDGAPDAEAKANFLRLEEVLVAPILAQSRDNIRALRPLLDFFKTIGRNM